jgi:hypothetical protein
VVLACEKKRTATSRPQIGGRAFGEVAACKRRHMASCFAGSGRILRADLAESDAKVYFSHASTMGAAANYIVDLAARGRYHFTTQEAAAALGSSVPTVRAALRRLKARGEIADPYRGFHVIVPPEYRRLGSLPADQFLPQLMQHLGEPYYVALLSAAELHGAAHQRPQALQVMVKTNRRAIECGEVRVQFISRKEMEDTAVAERKTPRGLLRVASARGDRGGAGGLRGPVRGPRQRRGCSSPSWPRGRRCGSARCRSARGARSRGCSASATCWTSDGAPRPRGQARCRRWARRAQDVAPLVRARSRSGAPRDDRWRLAVNVDRGAGAVIPLGLHLRVARARAMGAGSAGRAGPRDLACTLVELFSREFDRRGASRSEAARRSTSSIMVPAARYSEDIDLVQTRNPGGIGEVLDAIHDAVSIRGWASPQWKQSEGRVTLSYRFESEEVPPMGLKLKVEINSREHFSSLRPESRTASRSARAGSLAPPTCARSTSTSCSARSSGRSTGARRDATCSTSASRSSVNDVSPGAGGQRCSRSTWRRRARR